MPPKIPIVKRKLADTGSLPPSQAPPKKLAKSAQPSVAQFFAAPSTSDSSQNSSVPLNGGPSPDEGFLTADQRSFLAQISASRSNWGSALAFPFRNERVRQINQCLNIPSSARGECLVYWMSRDSRVQGTHLWLMWIVFATTLGKALSTPLK